MKALTVYQPWATLIALEAKPYEFRGHDYAARNRAIAKTRIAIHASTRAVQYKEVVDLRDRLSAGVLAARPNTGGTGLHARALPILEKIVAGMQGRGDEFPLPLGAIVCVATIGEAVNAGILFKGEPTNDSDRDGHALFAWPMIDVQSVPPIPCRGNQGFWNLPLSIEKELHYAARPKA